ncbi:MAG: fluoride efflux transporter CrcB [Bacteroidota bacterium]|nr:fluoride efflux transporter CrcB [Bacteroidota bacterium]MDP4230107.1 fluoride efflux transporter CrcB [Bacteroidota bacterium]MDP4236752.1 fluoride efflux transporter CrcB [Bacteroidota bacterium]
MIYLYLAIGSVAGAMSRYQLGLWVTGISPNPLGFPWATFLINISGSFVMGFLMEYLSGVASSREMRAMLTVGFCGSYTTFSTFSHESITLLREGQTSLALLYGGGSFLLAPIAYLIGYLIARSVR